MKNDKKLNERRATQKKNRKKKWEKATPCHANPSIAIRMPKTICSTSHFSNANFPYYSSALAMRTKWRKRSNYLRNTKSETLKRSFNRKNQHVISQLNPYRTHVDLKLQMNDRWNVRARFMPSDESVDAMVCVHCARENFPQTSHSIRSANVYLLCVFNWPFSNTSTEWIGWETNPSERFIFIQASHITENSN